MREMVNSFTAVFVEAEEGGYVAYAEELPGANTQGETLEEARENLREAIQLVLEANRQLAERQLTDQTAIREPITITRRSQ
jgi:predicted RNase H-like HicB family nuclease